MYPLASMPMHDRRGVPLLSFSAEHLGEDWRVHGPVQADKRNMCAKWAGLKGSDAAG